MKAILHNYRQTPRRVGLVAGLIRGKKVKDALIALEFTTKRASLPMKRLLLSAVANAKNNGAADAENLFITKITVDKGMTLKRMLPRARGSSSPIRKRASNVVIELGEKKTYKKKSSK